MTALPAIAPEIPAIQRLAALAPLDEAALDLLRTAARQQRAVVARREILTEGQAIGPHLLLLSGWAARVRVLEDGRRQILAFILPGDFLTPERDIAPATVVAVNDLTLAPAPDVTNIPCLEEAYRSARLQEECRMLAHITRIGQMSAQERIVDLLLEFHDRMAQAGLIRRNRFPVPLTQDVLADAVGLTSIHVNRTLMSLRRRGDLEWRAREMTLPNLARLRAMVGQENTSPP
ncbi:Crp/Fnr family transcriptional regulator [Croceibacterium sp. TMG7-5b_MA50]|uniref:Crp/Fnr family transcriptional regulator n=1 Tax=Croceibacterium sp. TMG7-5b_MA50 TaxID=3121290 RepID=UPI0032216983